MFVMRESHDQEGILDILNIYHLAAVKNKQEIIKTNVIDTFYLYPVVKI